jgi:rod shape determining protein RodA
VNIDSKTAGIIFPSLVLISFSLAILGSIDPNLLQQQALYLIIGTIFFFIFSFLDYHVYSFFTWGWYTLSTILLGLTFVLGSESRGSIRWIDLGFIRFQPSEFVKPLLIIFFAVFIANSASTIKSYLKLIISSSLPILFIFQQPDLGSAIIVLAVMGVQLISSTIPKKYLLTTLIPILVISPIAFRLLKPYQIQRIQSFIDPTSDPLGSGYNSIQSVIAVGSGRITGRGLGQGTQSQLDFLPERQTDFIFAAIAEEFGFLGAITIIVAYAYLLKTILDIAAQSKDETSKLLSIGVFSTLCIQVFINIGMNMGLLPITGITLPLISSGGSSLISTAMMLGIVINASRSYKTNQASLEIH